MNPLAWLLVAGAVFLGGLTTGIKVMSWKHGAENAARLEASNEAYDKSAKKIDGVSEALEGVVANIGKKRIVVEKEIRHEIEKPAYRDCLVPASGVRLYQDSDKYATAPGQPSAGMPSPGDLAGSGEHGRLIGRGDSK